MTGALRFGSKPRKLMQSRRAVYRAAFKSFVPDSLASVRIAIAKLMGKVLIGGKDNAYPAFIGAAMITSLARIAFFAFCWISTIIIVGMIVPAALGYGYALTFFSSYEYACPRQPEQKNDPIPADDYRIYLLNRGCTLDAMMGEMGREYAIDPQVLKGLYLGKADPQSSNEVMLQGVVREQAYLFKPFPSDNRPDYGTDDAVTQLFNNAIDFYMLKATPLFLSAVAIGAEHITAIWRMGPLARGMIYLAYIIGLGILGAAIYDLMKRLLRSGGEAKK